MYLMYLIESVKYVKKHMADEIHFLFQCPGLKYVYVAYYKMLGINNCNNYIVQFIETICSKNSM